MRRFTILTSILSVSALLVWGVFQAAPAPKSSSEMANNNSTLVYHQTGEMSKDDQSGDLIVLVTGADIKIAPVYDSRGMLVSDPSNTIFNASSRSRNVPVPITNEDMRVAPVYNTTGALVSDPTGTVSSAANP